MDDHEEVRNVSESCNSTAFLQESYLAGYMQSDLRSKFSVRVNAAIDR